MRNANYFKKRPSFKTLKQTCFQKWQHYSFLFFLVRQALTWRAAAWHLHVELDGVHAQDGVTDVTEHVVAGFHPHESWQLEQLLQLGLPPYKQIMRGNVKRPGPPVSSGRVG